VKGGKRVGNNFDDAISCLRDIQQKTTNQEKKNEIERKIKDINSSRK
jgi:hypothetical protein